MASGAILCKVCTVLKHKRERAFNEQLTNRDSKHWVIRVENLCVEWGSEGLASSSGFQRDGTKPLSINIVAFYTDFVCSDRSTPSSEKTSVL